MDRIAAADVDAAVDEMVGLLAPHADGDWSTPAGTLEWSCWATAAHVAHDLAAYAAQLAARATDGYLPFDLVAEAGATPRDVLSVVAASGRLLSAAGSALPAGRRPPAPDAPAGDAAAVLLWATGRADLPGRSRVGSWVWRVAAP